MSTVQDIGSLNRVEAFAANSIGNICLYAARGLIIFGPYSVIAAPVLSPALTAIETFLLPEETQNDTYISRGFRMVLNPTKWGIKVVTDKIS
ncbi:hypothetical protein D5018_17310 [Parashewanella curva]|uniref:Uncharacterized protein n=1 Tax=Parashewanella curva TaxID=2338552 RepID=A0A3L8PSP2_9GAMM|nr:hypothetical protein [Parashewanella curva]RLV58437.1 hypothetical protein D5018_17310 [Parashewanella curva]